MAETSGLLNRRTMISRTESSNLSVSATFPSAEVFARSENVDFPGVLHCLETAGVRAGAQASGAIHGINHGIADSVHGIGGGHAE